MINSTLSKAMSLIAVALFSAVYSFAGNPPIARNSFNQLKDNNGIYWNLDGFGILHIETVSGQCPDFEVSPFISYKNEIKAVVFEDNNWSDYTHIGRNMFKGMSGIKSITLPGALKSIGENAFEGCTSLRSLNIPESVELIGEGALKGCDNLQSLTLPFAGSDGSGWVNNTEKNNVNWVFGSDASIPSSLCSLTVRGGYVDSDTFSSCAAGIDITVR